MIGENGPGCAPPEKTHGLDGPAGPGSGRCFDCGLPLQAEGRRECAPCGSIYHAECWSLRNGCKRSRCQASADSPQMGAPSAAMLLLALVLLGLSVWLHSVLGYWRTSGPGHSNAALPTAAHAATPGPQCGQTRPTQG